MAVTRATLICVVVLSVLSVHHTSAAQESGEVQETVKTPEQLIDESHGVLQAFLRDPKMPGFSKYIKDAKAIVIVPSFGRAGLLIGFSGGKGIMLRRTPSNSWNGPAFYNLSGAGFGVQLGASVSRLVMLVMNDRSAEKILDGQIKFGGGVSVAAGPVGIGEGTSGTEGPSEQPDVYSYVSSKGLYVGISVEGMAMQPVPELNTALYRQPASPEEILTRGQFHSDAAAGLITELGKAVQ